MEFLFLRCSLKELTDVLIDLGHKVCGITGQFGNVVFVHSNEYAIVVCFCMLMKIYGGKLTELCRM